MTLNPFGRALSPVEITQSRYLDALLAFRPLTCLRMEDDGGSGSGDSGGGGGDNGSGQGGTDKQGSGSDSGKGGDGSDKGYPPNTPIAEMTDAQRAAYFEEKARVEENRRKDLTRLTGGKYGDDLKAEMDELARLRTERMTDSEKAIETARNEGRAAAQREFAPKMAQVAFESALGHIEDDTQRAKLIDGIALEKFITPEGDVDTAKVKEHVALIAPAKGTTTRPDNFGQGPRGGGAQSTGVSAGAALYADGKKKSTSS